VPALIEAPWFNRLIVVVLVINALGRAFFRDGWNWFDLVVIVLSAIPASGTLLMLRTVRILRTSRLISVIVNAMERQVLDAHAAKEQKVEQTHHTQLMAELTAMREQLPAVQTELSDLRANR